MYIKEHLRGIQHRERKERKKGRKKRREKNIKDNGTDSKILKENRKKKRNPLPKQFHNCCCF